MSADVLKQFDVLVFPGGSGSKEAQKGRVIAISPHPELTNGLESMIGQAIRWLAGGN